MSNSTAFAQAPLAFASARAFSPAIAALASGTGAGASAAVTTQAATSARRTALEVASTVNDVILTIPSNYRETLANEVRFVADIAEKLVHARASTRKLASFLNDGNAPSNLSMKVPELQACKEFREAGLLASANQTVRETIVAAETAVVKAAHQAKTAEVEHLEGVLNNSSMFGRMKDLVLTRWSVIRERSKVPSFTPVTASGSHAEDIELTSWEVDPGVVSECNALLADLWPIATRTIAIVEAREAGLQAKIAKKKVVEKSADVEMADASKPGPSIQSLVDKAVAGRVKPLAAQVQKLSVKGGKSAAKQKSDGKKKSSPSAKPKKPSAPARKGTSSKTNKPSVKGGKGKGKAGN